MSLRPHSKPLSTQRRLRFRSTRFIRWSRIRWPRRPGNRTGGNQIAHSRHAGRTGRGVLRIGPRHRNTPSRRRIPHVHQARSARRGARFRQEPEAAVRLSLPALETLAVVATSNRSRCPRSAKFAAWIPRRHRTLLDRKLITTAGRKAVIGVDSLQDQQGILLRFGLKDVHELPSMEEFEKLLAESFQSDLLPSAGTPWRRLHLCHERRVFRRRNCRQIAESPDSNRRRN